MSISNGGTITLEGKTYNISQINSVYVGRIRRYPAGGVWGLWFVSGLLCLLFVGSAIWFLLSIAALVAVIYFASLENYAVFFDMSSGKVSAYSDPDMGKVERIREDIVVGLQKGYFPNYLRGGR